MSQEQYQKKTGAIYGTLFSNYGDKLFNDSVELFFKRHKRWGIDTEWFQGKSCLDAGCGGGRFMVALSRLGAREVKGIDISDGAVNLANERLRERGFPNAEAAVASVLKIPFADNRFDYVVSSGVIHHTPTPHVAFKELVRVLKPRGKLFLSIYIVGFALISFVRNIDRKKVIRLRDKVRFLFRNTMNNIHKMQKAKK